MTRSTDGGSTRRQEPTGLDTTRDERAVSDVIGFVLTFTVIIASVALVSTIGLQTLEEMQGDEQENNAQRAFNIMAENFQEIERGRAPRRISELSLHDGSLTVDDGPEFTVGVAGTGFNETIPTRRIRYRRGETIIAYENGGTLRGNTRAGGSAMQHRPELICTDDRALISIVQVETELARSLSGGTVRVTGSEESTTLLYPRDRAAGEPQTPTSGSRVNVVVGSELANGWANHFEDSGEWVRQNPQKWSCSGVEQVYVRKTVIDVTFSR